MRVNRSEDTLRKQCWSGTVVIADRLAQRTQLQGDPYMITKRYVTPMLIALGMLQAMPTQGGEVGYLPPTQTQNGITYVTGGFGVDESCAMKEAAGNYDLMLTFAERDGSYVADVNVQIIDRSGQPVLDTVSGPLLLASLPAGEYRVRADYDGMSRWQTVRVGGERHSRLAFTWPSEIGRERVIGGGAEFSAFEASEIGTVKACR
jgi:hypothetical protein